ncbi:ISL3 family transposase [Halorhodospira neutriphila]|uniref:ISL3 family transposase n=1 Tax=Halorhodospira neutriphila TaxID=168379 RepID=A0ABS1E1P5_9GAMM|nr:ISL3 family transposase [Halorhodospira neutriphila]MBK1725626.1 ISL3 family transposase [Halorhodospira neutriphila]
MAQEHALFTAALGLSAPWEVSDIRFDAEAKRIDFDVTFASSSRFACPACGAEGQPVHDTRERTWQHLHFFEHQAYIHAAVPRVHCQAFGKTKQVEVPWARPESGFSELFEALVITLCQQMPVRQVAAYLGIGDDPVWRILDHYVGAARAQEDFSGVRAVGIDETASRRGQNDITVFQELEERRLLFACEGRDQATVGRSAEDLREHGGEPASVEAACIDMSKAYIAGVQRHLPQAAITFDAFHVVQLANNAVDQVRRTEVRTEPELKRTRWVWLKDAWRHSLQQLTELHHLSRMRLKTARAWRLKNAQIQAAKARARGFRTTCNLITVCDLIGGKFTRLPASPYGTTCKSAAA